MFDILSTVSTVARLTASRLQHPAMIRAVKNLKASQETQVTLICLSDANQVFIDTILKVFIHLVYRRLNSKRPNRIRDWMKHSAPLSPIRLNGARMGFSMSAVVSTQMGPRMVVNTVVAQTCVREPSLRHT